MKKQLLFFCCLGFNLLFSFSQEFSLQYGKVTQAEIELESYEKDSTANAVVIFQKGDSYYEYINGNFKVVYNYETKIKILNQEGTDHANIVIPIYQEEKQNQRKEVLSRLEAYAYNLEGGKVVKNKMDKSYVHEERISPYRKLVKFSVPSVKAGTVIEYKYRITSDYYSSLNEWSIQKEIPVHFAQYQIKIPEYFNFSLNSKGYETIDVKETLDNQTFTINLKGAQTESVTCTCRKFTFTSNDVPALKDDGYIWCIDDFTSEITFELNGIQFPYDMYRPFTTTWEDIEKRLKESDSWGSYLSFRNPYKDEMKLIDMKEMNTPQKIITIFHLLKSKISWNEKYGLYGNNVRKAIKEGTGTNAEINFVLLSMLKDAGINAYPVLLSRRSMGRLPYAHPSLNAINTFIIGAMTSDTTLVYLDGSIEYGDINALPPTLMADRARVFDPQKGSYWKDLSTVGNHRMRAIISATINEEGKLVGERRTTYNGLNAALYRKDFYNAKDSITYIEELEKDKEVTITSFQQTGIEKQAPEIRQTTGFEKTLTRTENHIYFNPLIFPTITENPFIEEERKLPVELPYPYEARITVSLTIPEDYEIEELPETIRFATEKGDFTCGYTVQNNIHQVTINYLIQFKSVIIPPQDYLSFKSFWEKVVEKNTEQIVLKKKAI